MSGSSGTDKIPEAATTNGAVKVSPASVCTVQIARLLVEAHGDDLGVERDVATKVEPVGDEIQISLDLGLGRHRLRPHPFLLNLVGEAVGVLDALDVTPRTGIAVVQPSAADVFGHLQHPDLKTELTQAVQRVQAGEAGADHEHIEAWIADRFELVSHCATPPSTWNPYCNVFSIAATSA